MWPGGDGAGVVDAVGDGVDGWAPGAEVIVNPSLGYAPTTGHIPFSGKLGVLGEHAWGTLAEYVVVPATNLVPKPAHLSPGTGRRPTGWPTPPPTGCCAGPASATGI